MPCASSSIPNQRNLRMSLTSSLDALSKVSARRHLHGVSMGGLLVLDCITGLTTRHSYCADLSTPKHRYFFDLPSEAVCVRCNIPRNYLSLTARGPMCSNDAPSMAIRTGSYGPQRQKRDGVLDKPNLLGNAGPTASYRLDSPPLRLLPETERAPLGCRRRRPPFDPVMMFKLLCVIAPQVQPHW
jgi:hypothetical protein